MQQVCKYYSCELHIGSYYRKENLQVQLVEAVEIFSAYQHFSTFLILCPSFPNPFFHCLELQQALIVNFNEGRGNSYNLEIGVCKHPCVSLVLRNGLQCSHL